MTDHSSVFPRGHRNRLDTDSLSWVVGEIREVLESSKAALFEAVSQDEDVQLSSLQLAKADLHRAHGALQVVGVGSAAQLTGVIEQLFEEIESRRVALTQKVVAAIEQAYQAVVGYLEELNSGIFPESVRLFPYCKILLELLGMERVHPADLLFLDFEVQPVQPLENVVEIDYAVLRQQFEQALLSFLKGNGSELNSVALMSGLVQEIEQAQCIPESRGLWWVIRAFMEEVAGGRIPVDQMVKQLCARVNFQIRRHIEGDFTTSNELLREALFYIALVEHSPLEVTQEVRSVYQLEGLVPADYQQKRYGKTEVTVFNEMREHLTEVKNIWNRIVAGDVNLTSLFVQEMHILAETSRAINSMALVKFLSALEGISRNAVHSNLSAVIGLEMASGLLFAESALDHIGRHSAPLSENFVDRANELVARLLAVFSGEKPADATQWLDQVSRDAQYEQAMLALSTEMRINLRQIEKVLDDYFRDLSKYAELEKILPALHQIEGAFAILGLEDAGHASERTQRAIEIIVATETHDALEHELFGKIVQNISTLGFCVDALRLDVGSVKERFIFDSQENVFRMRSMEFFPNKEKMMAPAAQMPIIVSRNNDRTDEAQKEVVEGQIAEPVVTSEQSVHVESVPLSSEQDDVIDSELMEIFLSEAKEVLALMKEVLVQSRAERHNQEYLTTLRRSFHTLKGSGRMVGLVAFGDAAWHCERVLNLWLSEVRTGTEDLYRLLDRAVEELSLWVVDLAAHGRSDFMQDALVEMAAHVMAGESLIVEEKEAGEALSTARFFSEVDAEGFVEIKADPLLFDGEGHDDIGEQVSVKEEEEEEEKSASMLVHEESASDELEDTPAPQNSDAILDGQVKRIGDLEIGVVLYNIYLAETDELIRYLAQDFSEWRHEADRKVNTKAMHAAHSLAGSSATVGLKFVYEMAFALEMLLQGLARQSVGLSFSEYDVLDQTVICVKEMLQKFAAGEMPERQLDYVHRLNELQKALQMRAETREQEKISSMFERSDGVEDVRDDIGQESMVGDALDAELVSVFLEEGSDAFPKIEQWLRTWKDNLSDLDALPALLRQLHTIKGSARMAGAMNLGQHVHEMEAQIEEMTQSEQVSESSVEDLLAQYDDIVQLFEQLKEPSALSQEENQETDQASTDRIVSESVVVERPTSQVATPLSVVKKSTTSLVEVPLVRVRADTLDRLVNQAGEVSISRSRLEIEVGSLRSSLFELTENVQRLRGHLREMEIQAESQITSHLGMAGDRGFDPLEFDRFTRLQEITRMMAESVGDVAAVQQGLVRTVESATNDLTIQARLTRDLQHGLMQVRMVQFSSITERLYRVTRQTAKEMGKRINLDIRGGSVELDRGVLEKMTGTFEHLLRNAIVHGVESQEARRANGKNETGELLIDVRQEGNEVMIQFSDDGQGLDLLKIRKKAEELDLVPKDSQMSDEEMADLIFLSGFSTVEQVTELAGRGVGMDVVRSEVSSLGGRIELSSEPEKGTRFIIHLPLTLAVTQVVLVNTGGRTYAVPSVLFEQVLQLKANALTMAYNDGVLIWQGHRAPLYYLSSLIGDMSTVPLSQRHASVVILRSGNERVALHIDSILGNREAVVKNIGPQLSSVQGIVGATVLGSGEIVLILNPVLLAQRYARMRAIVSDKQHKLSAFAEMSGVAVSEPAQYDEPPSDVVQVQGLRKQRTVMVVDDSLTVRRVTQRALARAGYQVVLAKDGLDALEQLQEVTPDVMLVDIEMPRMDGFDLTRNVRGDERTKHIPIIMITSRTADKHRNFAMGLGVDDYLGKPYNDEVLLRSIAQLIEREQVKH